MKHIKELATVPELIQITIDDEQIVKAYGEPIIFWTKSTVSLNDYFDFFDARGNVQYDNLSKIIKRMILLEDGSRALADDEELPVDITVVAINKIGELLGKSQTKSSTKKVGKQRK